MLLCLWLLLGFSAIDAREDPEKKRKQLQKLEQQLKEKQAGYKKIEKEEKNLVAELRTIEQLLKTYQQQLQDHRNTLEKKTKELKKIQGNLNTLQKTHTQKKAALAKRLRAIYKMGDFGYLTPLFATSSYDNMQQQIKYLQLISKSDRQLINDTRKDIQVIRKQKEELEKSKQEIERAQREIKKKQTQIHTQKNDKDQLLKRIRHDKKQFAQMITRLETSASELDQFLNTLETRKKPSTPKLVSPEPGKDVTFPDDQQQVIQSYGKYFRANKGKLLWPVQGKIITNYGKIKYGGTYTFYKGVDIQATRGTPFYSVFKGTVKYADWFEGYGNLVIVDHGGNYYTLYAHADEIAVKMGETIDTRQELGKIGDTDSIKGAHLYFEIRANGKPVDPKRWLAKVR